MPQVAIPAVVAGGFAAVTAGTIFTATVYTAFFATLALGVVSHVFADRARTPGGIDRGRGGGAVGGARSPAAERIVFGRWRTSGDVAWFEESDTILRMGIALSAGNIDRIEAVWSLEHDERVPIERGRLAYDHFLGDDDIMTYVPVELRPTADPPGPGATNVLDGTPSFKVLDSWSAHPVFRVDAINDGSTIYDTTYKQDLISYQASLLSQIATALDQQERIRLLAEFEDAGGLLPGFNDPLSDLAEGLLTDAGIDPGGSLNPLDPGAPTLGESAQDVISGIADAYGLDQTQTTHVVDHFLSVLLESVSDINQPTAANPEPLLHPDYRGVLQLAPEVAAQLFHSHINTLAEPHAESATDAALALAEAINTHAELVGVGPAPDRDILGTVTAAIDIASGTNQPVDDDEDGNGDAGGGGGGVDRGGDDPNDPGFR